MGESNTKLDLSEIGCEGKRCHVQWLVLLLELLNISHFTSRFRHIITTIIIIKYHYDNLFEELNLLTLHNRRRHFDALFLMYMTYRPIAKQRISKQPSKP
jgi:hypothetical protein